MANDQRTDPYRGYNFMLEIDNVPKGAFAEVGGLTAEGDSVDYREGTDVQSNVRKLPGLRKYTNVTLKRGITQDKSLWQWYTNILNGVPDRRSVTIVLLDEARQPALRWHCENAWISSPSSGSTTTTRQAMAGQGRAAGSIYRLRIQVLGSQTTRWGTCAAIQTARWGGTRYRPSGVCTRRMPLRAWESCPHGCR